MVLDPGRAGFPRQHDDREEKGCAEQRHDDRGVASQSHKIEEARRQITSFLRLPNERCDVADRDPGITRSPERDLGV